MAYCNITTDLTDVYPRLRQLRNSRITADDWVVVSGSANTYQQEGLGQVNMVFDDGVQMAVQTSIANVQSNAGSWFYVADTDILYIHPFDSDDMTATPPDPTIEIGIDWDSYLDRERDNAMEEMDSYCGSKYIVPLQPRLIKIHSSNDYESIIKNACAYLICRNVARSRDPDSNLSMGFEQRALGFNPEDGEEMGYIAKILAGEINLQDQITPLDAMGTPSVIPSASNTTGYIRIQPKISQYTGSAHEVWRLEIEATDGVPGTALYKLSYDQGATFDITGQTTFDANNNNRRINIGRGIYVVFWGTFVEGDYWDLELYPTTDLVTNPQIGSIPMERC